MSISEKVYHFLLRAYPRAYRSCYAQPMQQLFRDRLRQANTFGELVTLWVRTLSDWMVSMPPHYYKSGGLVRHTPQLRLLDPAQRCLFFARNEASSFSSREIKLEHLLLGILRQEGSLVPDVEAVLRAVEANESAGRRVAPVEDLRLSRETARAWLAAKLIARDSGRTQVVPSDLIAAILRESNTLAARLLRGQS